MNPSFIVSNNWDHTECGEAAQIAIQWFTYHLPGAAVIALSDGSPTGLFDKLSTGGDRLIHTGAQSGLMLHERMSAAGRTPVLINLFRKSDGKEAPQIANYHGILVTKPLNKFEFFRLLEKILASYNDKPVRPKTDRLTAR